MPSYLITGASRGLGLGLTTELLKTKGNVVVATARSTAGSSGLQELKARYGGGQLVLVDMDVSNQESIRTAAEKAAHALPGGLDHLISNAGISSTGLDSFEELSIDDFTSELTFTVTAPIMLIRAFLPLIRRGASKKILVVSSGLGSIEMSANLPNLANGYSIARAALNMMARKWSPVLKTEGITISILHPGWIGATGLGSNIKDWVDKYNPSLENLTVEKSAAECVKVLNGLGPDDSGAFYNWDGSKLPF